MPIRCIMYFIENGLVVCMGARVCTLLGVGKSSDGCRFKFFILDGYDDGNDIRMKRRDRAEQQKRKRKRKTKYQMGCNANRRFNIIVVALNIVFR